MAQSPSVAHLYMIINVGNNNISAEGLGHLLFADMNKVPETKMPKLQELFLGAFNYYSDFNHIGSKGARMIVKAELPFL